MTLRERLNVYEKLMRLDKPIGILLLLWPTLWALWISSNGQPRIAVLWIFCLGVVLMRSAGCVINDIADRHFDKYVERTKDRPLATGQISVKEAGILAASLILIAFLLILPLNRLVLWLSFPALFLALTYPFTKRFFALPQAYLGIAFGFGIPMAFAAQLNFIPTAAWVLLIANVFWAIAYDTEYAMIDREDDIKLGLKSSAILFGKYDVLAVMLCYAIMFAILMWLGWQLNFGFFYQISLICSSIIMAYQYFLIKDRQRDKCFKAFLKNNWIGTLIFIGLIFNYTLPF